MCPENNCCTPTGEQISIPVTSLTIPCCGMEVQVPANAFPAASGGEGLRTWESDWFNIAAKGSYEFSHDLNLPDVWKFLPRAVLRVKTAQSGWSVGDVIFTEGCNYVGTTSQDEMGWAISLTSNEIHITFGNDPAIIGNKKTGGFGFLNKTSVECKLLISY